MTSLPPEPPAGSPATPTTAEPAPDHGAPRPLALALLIYTGLRLLLVAALTALLMIFMPLIVALLFAYALQLPLAYLLFGRSRRQVNEGIARATARRRSERARLQGALTGDPDPAAPDPAAPDDAPRP